MSAVKEMIQEKILSHPPGWAFSAKDFMEFGSRGSIDVALSTLQKNGVIRRVFRGVYDQPRYSSLLKKPVAPDVDHVVRALARKHGWRLQATGAMAANLLGLSEQVPAKAVYLIDGACKDLMIGNTKVLLKHTEPKNLNVRSEKSALVIQALKHIGKPDVSEEIISRIAASLTVNERDQLLDDAHFVTDWIFETIKQIVAASGSC